MMSKTANIVLKDSPAEPLLPQKLFTEPDLVSEYDILLQSCVGVNRCLLDASCAAE